MAVTCIIPVLMHPYVQVRLSLLSRIASEESNCRWWWVMDWSICVPETQPEYGDSRQPVKLPNTRQRWRVIMRLMLHGSLEEWRAQGCVLNLDVPCYTVLKAGEEGALMELDGLHSHCGLLHHSLPSSGGGATYCCFNEFEWRTSNW